VCLGAIGRVTKVWADAGVPMGLVDTGDREAPVCLLYVPEASEGDHVLVHMGMAVELLDEAEAAATLALRRAAAERIDPHEEGPR
jgi:hydrogenase expression/formation protein HypC